MAEALDNTNHLKQNISESEGISEHLLAYVGDIPENIKLYYYEMGSSIYIAALCFFETSRCIHKIRI